MIGLPELTQEERAYLHSTQPEGSLQVLADRLRQKLVVITGKKVSVRHLPGSPAHAVPGNDEPVIEIEPGLANGWLTVRYGGKAEAKAWQLRDSSLLLPLVELIRRTLAETVFNTGKNTAWPHAMRFQASIGTHQGMVQISWNSEHALSWAQCVIRENK